MKKFMIALQFLTTLPVKIKNIREEELPGLVAYYPLVGLLLGLILAGLWLFFKVIFPVPVSALLLISSYLLLTGALHVDGFVDTVDGLYGGRTKKEIFRIMEGSTIGAKGAVWLVLLIALKAALLTVLLRRGVYPVLILFPVLGRYAITILMKFSAYPKKNGLGKAFCGKITNTVFVLINIFVLAVALCYKVNGLASFLAVVLLALIVMDYFKYKIGGVTGDVFGFTIEISEIAVLLLFVAGR